MYLFNPTYMMFMLPAFLIMLVTQWYVSSSYRKWSKVPNRNRLSGAEAAQRLIRNSGLYDVHVEGVAGNLTDHYDPRQKVLA
jgi:Zn-dependent membrane protease YugP